MVGLIVRDLDGLARSMLFGSFGWFAWMLAKCLWIKCECIYVGTITGNVRACVCASVCVIYLYL